MAKKNNEPEADIDLTEPIPEGLGGGEEGGSSQSGYVPAVRQGMGVATESAPMFDLSSVRPPWLQLVTPTSAALQAAGFNAGDLVLKKETLVCPRGKTMQVILLSKDQYVREILTGAQWDAGQRPRAFKNYAEAKKAGLRIAWGDVDGRRVGPDVSDALDMLVLIRRNDDVSPALFSQDIGVADEHGKPTSWAFALISIDKTAAKVFLNDVGVIANGQLKDGLWHGLWEWRTELAQLKVSRNRPMVIRAKFLGRLDPAVADNVRGALEVPAPNNAAEGDEFP